MRNILIGLLLLAVLGSFFVLTKYVSPYCIGLVFMPGAILLGCSWYLIGKELGLVKADSLSDFLFPTDWIDNIGKTI